MSVTRKQHAKFSDKRTFLTPLKRTRAYAYHEIKNVRFFFGKFGVLCFLVTPVLRFAILPYYQQASTLSNDL